MKINICLIHRKTNNQGQTMKFLLLMVLAFIIQAKEYNQEDLTNWRIINDGVMGGLSKGAAQKSEDFIEFSGEVSLENNGGFSSFRAPYGRYDLSKFEKLVIRYRSTGIKVGFTMNMDQRFWMPYYKYLLPNSEEWTEIEIPLKDFDLYQLLNKTGNKLNSDDLEKVIRIGFITSEKKGGPFKFDVEWVKFI